MKALDCIAIFGIVLFASSCESTTQATTRPLKQCSFNHINYNLGETWNPFLLPHGYYRCIKCVCKLSFDGSLALVDCTQCRNPSTPGIPPPNEQQRSCAQNSIRRIHGAVWTESAKNPISANQCKECSCTDGFVTCAIRTCPVLSCQSQTRRNGTCCPVCAGDLQTLQNPTGCQTMGRFYGHTETWHPKIPPRYDMCTNCTCKNATIECRKHDCPSLTCQNPQRKPGECCDSCPANFVVKVKKTFSSKPSASIRSLIRLRLRVRKRNRITDFFKTRAGRKVRPRQEDCEWGKKKFSHNSTFHPTIVPFGVSYCVTCLCNNTRIDCWSKTCPLSYPCKTPVSVPRKCCKVCGGSVEGSPTPTHSSGRRQCSAGKYWRVYEYAPFLNQPLNTSELRRQFVLEDTDNNYVEIHTIVANVTIKEVTVSNTTKRNFNLILGQNSNAYKYSGKIRHIQSNKIKIWEQRGCHPTNGCIHTVLKIMERLRERVKRCEPTISRPPDTLLMLKKTP